ncbi:MAG TPA: hypothetical protein VMA32_04980 [Streptosporangiaceae bacterium]|nr:hypothetical protein [Streptosporangiaceae bacterium]
MSHPGTARIGPQHRRDTGAAGVAGNAKLTAMTGAVLLLGFAIEGVTVLEVHRLLVVHFLVGLLLIGPVLLKIASTVYRFARYYAGALPYVRKGPPAPLLRLLGPLVIVTSVAVLGTGVLLAIVGPGNGPWLFLHKASFILWFGVMTIHVLNYAPRLPRLLSDRSGTGQGTAVVVASPARWLALAASLVVGVAVAAVTMQMSAKWGISFW